MDNPQLPAKLEKGEATPSSQRVQSFAQKETPGAPKKGGDEFARKLRPTAEALDMALKEIVALTKADVKAAEKKASEAQEMVLEALKVESSAKGKNAEAIEVAKKAAAVAMEANKEVLTVNTDEARVKAKEAEERSEKAKAEAKLAAMMVEGASIEVERALKAQKDAKEEAESVKIVLATMNWQGEDWAIQDGIHEDEVKFRYSEYVSYCKDKNPGYPIRAWTLSEEQLDRFRTRYIISRDLSADQVRKKIDDLLQENARRIREEDDFWFDIPKRDLQYFDYCRCLGLPLLRRGHTAKRSFSNGNTKHQACITAWLLNYLHARVGEGFELTERLVFYDNKLLLRDPKAVARALTDICYLLECTERSLYILPLLKGEVRGKLLLKTTDPETGDVDCSKRGMKIPLDIRTISQIEMDNSVEFVLVVEKETMFRCLSNVKFHEKHNCILVCGMGMPDERTRGFVRMLDEKLGIPIFGITDPDPFGILIMRTYAKGSINLALCNVSYAANSIHWLGISTEDIVKIKHEDLQYVLDRCAHLNSYERTMLRRMKSPAYGLSSLWTRRIDHMLYFNRKACFEDLNVIDRNFASTVHIPELIKRVKRSMDKARGDGSTSCIDAPVEPAPKCVPALAYDHLMSITRNFGLDALVDDGPYGCLYSAVQDEKKIAVKRLITLPDNDFVTHVKTVSGLNHPSFAVLLGFCAEHDEQLLVYEFSTTLHNVLHGGNQTLGWKQRIKTAIDIAKGVEYLHGQGQVHGDIRSHNVLIFENSQAKILDLKLPNQYPKQHATIDRGVMEYFAPEYRTNIDQRTQQGDVFSFGVVLLELLTGKNPADQIKSNDRDQNLISWGTMRLEGGWASVTVDRALNRTFSVTEADMFGGLVLLCLKRNPKERPSIVEVVKQLSAILDAGARDTSDP